MTRMESFNSKGGKRISSELSVLSRIIDAETLRNLNQVFKIAKKSVCKVKPTHSDQGTGAFMNVLDDKNKLRFLFMTCNHVLPTNSLNEVSQTILEFEDVHEMKKFSFSDYKNHVKHIWTSKLYDATVVEINEELARLLTGYGVRFLKAGQIARTVEVVIPQYPNGKYSISHGIIECISGYEVFYRIATEPGSSGAPVLDWQGNALAMHKSAAEGRIEKVWRNATALNAIINAYLKEQTTDFFLYVNLHKIY